VLSGVTIGPGCVIGAGAVVTNECDANGLYVGVRAVRKKDLPVDAACGSWTQGPVGI
jgi:acetyltransferase-like isoleucine patch superfamily enzyme